MWKYWRTRRVWTDQNVRTKRLSLRRPLRLLALGFATLAHGQTVPTQATTVEIDQWLRSGEPRLVAWGATFAAKNTDTAELPILATLAEDYRALPPRQYDGKGMYVPRTPAQKERFDSMQAVLDSLIQLHGAISDEAIEAVLPDFSARALTLFGRMPEPKRSQFAEAVYPSCAENPAVQGGDVERGERSWPKLNSVSAAARCTGG